MGRRRGTKLLLDRLLPQRRDAKQTDKVASALLEGNANKPHRQLYMKGIHNGRFYRVKLNDPSAKKSPQHLPRLPGDGEVPHAFKKVPRRTGNAREKTKGPTKEASVESGISLPKFLKQGGDFSYEETAAYMKAWWKENWSTVVLNFGSVCTLIGFTRSDVLELRCLSVTGSAANVVYHFTQKPFRPLPVVWSAVFAAVNSHKIREILLERHSNVRMTPEQEDIFIQHFMPHGITPRQFQILQQSAKKITIPSGEAIIKQGEVCDHVKLVVSGSTRASISGRRLTAASSIAPKSITEEKAGGNSGAWVGEMNFLEYYHNKVGAKTKKKPTQEKSAEGSQKKSPEEDGTDSKKNGTQEGEMAKNALETPQKTICPKKDEPSNSPQSRNGVKKDSQNESSKAPQTKPKPTVRDSNPPPLNRYTIVAADECVIWQWSFDEVEKMMNRSTDFRASLTRAMTAAVVAKVVNFTISKTSQLPNWSTWLDDWRHNAGASVKVNAVEDDIVVEEVEEKQTFDHGGLDEHGGGV